MSHHPEDHLIPPPPEDETGLIEWAERMTGKLDKLVRWMRRRVIAQWVVVGLLTFGLLVLGLTVRRIELDRQERILAACHRDNRERDGDLRIADAHIDGLVREARPAATPEEQERRATSVENIKRYLHSIIDETKPERDCSNL